MLSEKISAEKTWQLQDSNEMINLKNITEGMCLNNNL